jgi:hypothetical protein
LQLAGAHDGKVGSTDGWVSVSDVAVEAPLGVVASLLR